MKNVVIIGGGVSGLTAGIYCAMNGISCEIIEKNSFCGGNLTGWTREGCYIDNCFHWLTGTLPGTELYRIWRDIGMIVDRGGLYQPETFYESVSDNGSVTFSRYPEVTRLNMLRISPDDAVEINRFIKAVEAVGNFMAKRLPSASLVSVYSHYRGITLLQLSEKFKHPLLKKAFTDYFGEYFSAIALVWAYGAFISGNGMIPRGGSKRAAERIESRFIELGGRIRRSCLAERLVTDGKRAYGVVTDGGEYIRAQAIICACDPAVTFSKLISAERMPRSFSRVYGDFELAPRFSSVQAAFSCPCDSIPSFGTRVISCRINDKASRLVVKEYSHEPSFSPVGTAIIQAMLFTDSDESENWINIRGDKDKYQSEKAAYAEGMKVALIKAFPSLNGELRCIDIWTPATYHSYFLSDHGSYMAFALTPKTPFRRYSCRLRGYDNVFIATQWQCSPGGLPNAARSGRIAAEAVRKRLGASEIKKIF